MTELGRLIKAIDSLPVEIAEQILEYAMSDDLVPCLLSTFLPFSFMGYCAYDDLDAPRKLPLQLRTGHSTYCKLLCGVIRPEWCWAGCVEYGAAENRPLFRRIQLQHNSNWLLVKSLPVKLRLRRLAYTTFFRTKWFVITEPQALFLKHLYAEISKSSIPFHLRSCLAMTRNIFIPMFKDGYARAPPYIFCDNLGLAAFDQIQRVRLWHQPKFDIQGFSLRTPSKFLLESAIQTMTSRMNDTSRTMMPVIHIQWLLPIRLQCEPLYYRKDPRVAPFFPWTDQDLSTILGRDVKRGPWTGMW